jgi:hypothetical protein
MQCIHYVSNNNWKKILKSLRRSSYLWRGLAEVSWRWRRQWIDNVFPNQSLLQYSNQIHVIYFQLYIFFYQIPATCFGVLHITFRENFVNVFKTVSSLQGYYIRCIIKYKIHNIFGLTIFLQFLKTMYTSLFCIFEP